VLVDFLFKFPLGFTFFLQSWPVFHPLILPIMVRPKIRSIRFYKTHGFISAPSHRWLRNRQRKLCRCRLTNQQQKKNYVAANPEICSENHVATDPEISSENCVVVDAEIGSDDGVVSSFTFFFVGCLISLNSKLI